MAATKRGGKPTRIPKGAAELDFHVGPLPDRGDPVTTIT
jgi:hypothetical protein